MTALLVILWLAGGASRADVLGQVVTRAGTWAIAIVAILVVPRPAWGHVKPIGMFLAAVIALVALQLVPLPPEVWLHLPGRQILAAAAAVSGQPQPWRPISISPGATANALASLIVPVTALALMAAMSQSEQRRISKVILALTVLSALVASLQFTGARFDYPLVNQPPGAVSGLFANRNHFAVFAAIGCVLAPVLAFGEKGRSQWLRLGGVALLLLFVIVTLGSGSRTGAILSILGSALGLLIVREQITAELRRLPRGAALTLASIPPLAIAAVIGASVVTGRAVSVQRALSLHADEDLRLQLAPAVARLIRTYWPVGSGYGAFDPVFRISEPRSMLIANYYNHAHNDLLEVIMDGGLLGVLLLVVGVSWAAWKSAAAWRASRSNRQTLPRVGSAIVLIVLLASVTDYPARTPLIMGILVVAFTWLCDSPREAPKSPRHDHPST